MEAAGRTGEDEGPSLAGELQGEGHTPQEGPAVGSRCGPISSEGPTSDGDGVGIQIAMVPPCRFIVKATAGARVVGKGGESIRAIRATTHVSVKVFQDELPESFKRRNENIVVASCGETSLLNAAVNRILDRVFDRTGIPDPTERARSRPFAVDLLVPERAAASLVGPGGERVKALIEEVSCNIDVVREPLPGIDGQRRVRLLSREREMVENGVLRIQGILAELVATGVLTSEHFQLREALPTEEESERLRRTGAAGGEVPIRLLLGPGEAAVVVGRMGYNVMKLRDLAHVSVDAGEAPFFDPSESICVIARTSLENRLRVVRHVVADLASSFSLRQGTAKGADAIPDGGRHTSIQLLFPSDRWSEVSCLLDDNVEGQQSFGSLSQAGVESIVNEQRWISAGSASPFRMLELRGVEDAVVAVVWRLHQAMEPWEPFDVPPRNDAASKQAVEDSDQVGKRADAKGPSSRRHVVGDPIVPLRRPPPYQKQDAHEETSELPVAMKSYNVNHAVHHADTHHIPDQTDPCNHAPSVGSKAPPVEAVAQRVASAGVDSAGAGLESPSDMRALMSDGTAAAPVDDASQRRLALGLSPVQHATSLDIECPSSHGPRQSLLVRVSDDAAAACLASEASGIARRANVKLLAWPANNADGRPSSIEVVGSAAANAVACYLIQTHLWLSAVLGGIEGN